MKENLIQQLRFCSTLPSLPSVALKIIDLANSADTDMIQISHYISLDPALTAKILKPLILHCTNQEEHQATYVRRFVC